MAETEDWIPRTLLGRMVVEGKITTMSDALKSGLPLKETQIVDTLLPNLKESIINVNMVQRMTDSGRRVKFRVVVAVGNNDGFVGLGTGKAPEVASAITKATDAAKLNLIEIRRGCGSWECGCWQPHSIPFIVRGKSGSVEVTLKPAPRGVSLAVGDTAKKIIALSGVNDIWGFTKGKTRTVINFAYATFDALRNLSEVKVTRKVSEQLKIVEGNITIPDVVEEKEETKLEEIVEEIIEEIGDEE